MTEIACLSLLVFTTVALWTSRAEVIWTKPAEDWDGYTEWQPEYPGISAPPAPPGAARVRGGQPGRDGAARSRRSGCWRTCCRGCDVASVEA